MSEAVIAIGPELVEAIRKAGGRATLGDLIQATARPAGEIREAILPALSLVGGHVAVDDNGELIYSVERSRAVPADVASGWERFWRGAYKAFKAVFIASLTVALVGYFIIYVLLLVALAVTAIAAAAQGGDCDCDCDCDGCGDCGGCDACCACGDSCGANGCGDSCFACVTCGSDKAKEKRQELREAQADKRAKKRKKKAVLKAGRSARRRAALTKVRERFGGGKPEHLGFSLVQDEVAEEPPKLQAVYRYIFGPPEAPSDPRARERNILAFAKAHRGRVTASDAVTLTGLPIDQADAVLLQVASRYDGDVDVTEDGVIVYTFDRLLTSAAEDDGVLGWIREAKGGEVRVAELAQHLQIPAAAALARLEHLSALVGGRVEARGGQTVFAFPADARARIDEVSARNEALRDYTFAWDRMETSPAIIGVPAGKRGWIVGFNILNLVLSTLMSLMYLAGEELLEIGGEQWLMGYLPALFSWGVFLIPLTRSVAQTFRDRGRRTRNARRVLLLAVFHALEEDDDRVTTEELADVLQIGAAEQKVRRRLEAMLGDMARELEGSIDEEEGVTEAGGFTWTFRRVFEELHAVERERLSVDLDALALTEVVYDTAEPM